MNYTEIRKINVNEHVEKKNGLSYLSWAWAVDQMLTLDPEATWEYGEPKQYGETLMVFCTVTMFGKRKTAQLPVMDYKNKAIANPDAFAVNTAMQRCLAKAISLHGLGLYIYAGEDVPPDAGEEVAQQVSNAGAKPASGALARLAVDEQTWIRDVEAAVRKLANSGDIKGACDHVDEQGFGADQKAALWETLADDSKLRSAMKKEWNSRKEAA